VCSSAVKMCLVCLSHCCYPHQHLGIAQGQQLAAGEQELHLLLLAAAAAAAAVPSMQGD
jgi:hypothetical protein